MQYTLAVIFTTEVLAIEVTTDHLLLLEHLHVVEYTSVLARRLPRF